MTITLTLLELKVFSIFEKNKTINCSKPLNIQVADESEKPEIYRLLLVTKN